MRKYFFKPFICLFLLLTATNLTSCSTTQKVIKHGKLEVQTKMSNTVFLDPVEDNKRTVLVQIRNTSDKSGLDIEYKIKEAIQTKGYRIVTSPKDAQFMIQANILQIGKSSLDDPFSSLTGGYGSALEGVVIGGTIGAISSNNNSGTIVGTALLVGAANTIIASAIDVIQYSMITDLQISEKADKAIVSEIGDATLQQGTSGTKKSTYSEQTNWKKYQTRIVSVAKKVNLKFETAEPELTQGLIKSISGLL